MSFGIARTCLGLGFRMRALGVGGAFLLWCVHAWAENLTWTAPTTNEDCSPLTDLAKYRVYQLRADGTSEFRETTDTTYTWEPPLSRPSTVFVTAVDMSGNESEGSNELILCAPDLKEEVAKWKGLYLTLQITTNFWKTYYNKMLTELTKCQNR